MVILFCNLSLYNNVNQKKKVAPGAVVSSVEILFTVRVNPTQTPLLTNCLEWHAETTSWHKNSTVQVYEALSFQKLIINVLSAAQPEGGMASGL
jgi:hypothetical protein